MFWTKKEGISDIGAILAFQQNKEEVLGVKQPSIPTPDSIKRDMSALVNFSHTDGYKRYADELWARVIASLDAIMDETSSQDKVNYHRSKARAHLEDLRLAYQAREIVKHQSQAKQNVPSPR